MPVGKLSILAVLTIAICATESAAVAFTGLPWVLLCVGAVTVFVIAAHFLRLLDVRKLSSIVGTRT
jgi:hypothetical protein